MKAPHITTFLMLTRNQFLAIDQYCQIYRPLNRLLHNHEKSAIGNT
jgi:hypothetical protein